MDSIPLHKDQITQTLEKNPSTFGATPLSKGVVTHAIANCNLRDHSPAVMTIWI